MTETRGETVTKTSGVCRHCAAGIYWPASGAGWLTFVTRVPLCVLSADGRHDPR